MDTKTDNNQSPKKGMFQNVFFVGFLFLISLMHFVFLLLNHDYKIINIIFLLFSFYLFIQLVIGESKKSRSKF